jgi:GNAT superfamily N-acetyltransferase
MSVAQVWGELSACLATLASCAPGCETRQSAGVTTILTGTQDAAANRLYAYGPEPVDDALHSFVAGLRRRKSSGAIVAAGRAGYTVASISRKLDLRLAEPLLLLAAHTGELTLPKPLARPAAVETVATPAALAELLALVALVLDVQVARLAHVYPAVVLTRPDVRAYAARRDDGLVSCVTTIRRGAFTTVANVGTRPDLRGRGEATSLLAAVLARLGAGGGELFALNAAPRDTALYERLGFTIWDEGRVWLVGPRGVSTV